MKKVSSITSLPLSLYSISTYSSVLPSPPPAPSRSIRACGSHRQMLTEPAEKTSIIGENGDNPNIENNRILGECHHHCAREGPRTGSPNGARLDPIGRRM